MSRDPRFLWVGAAYDPSGHADELRGFLRAQELAGHEPSLDNRSWTARNAELSAVDMAMLARQRSRQVAVSADVAIHTALPGGTGHITGPVNVSRAMFETDRLPGQWLEPLLARDQVWVPCSHNLETFCDSGIPEHRLRILGGTLDFDLFDPATAPYPLDIETDRSVFLTNFDFSARKGWETLLRAWAQAFTDEDPVCLVLKTGSFYRGDDWVTDRISRFLSEQLGASSRRLAPIHLLTDLLSAAEMPALYAAADCYVLASRGEGWGRPFMEAQAMGLPTIASRWGGQREFMDEDTSWFVDGQLVAVPDDADLFNDLYAGHRWFEPDVDDLAARLREVAGDWSAARHRVAPARQRLIERFGAEATARRIMALGSELSDRSRVRRSACILRGRFGATESLAVVNDGLSRALEQAGYLVGLRPPGIAHVNADVPSISHTWPHDFTAVTDGPSIVVVPLEFGAAPREWVDDARRGADRVWAPSDYVRDRLVASGMPAGIVEVVPNGVDPERFGPDGPVRELPVRAGCTFLFVGGTTWRKGIDVLLHAWELAFAPSDDVALVVKDFGASSWYRGQTAERALRDAGARRDVAPVLHLDQDIPSRELPALYRAADVLVAPYRGEGFCLPALEAMACGRPVIHTGTGPTAEFVPDAAGWALDAQQVAIEPAGMPELAGEPHVQEPSLPALVDALRAAAGDRQERRRRGASARVAALRHSWSEVAQAAGRSLDTLRSEGLPLARAAQPDRIEVPDGHALVLYAPSWRREDRWSTALAAWSRAFADTDPVTLALLAGGQDPGALLARLADRLAAVGVDLDAVPDLLLCDRATTAADVVCVADAVLLDPGEASPGLLRRAPLTVTPDPDALRALRGRLLGSRPVPDAVGIPA